MIKFNIISIVNCFLILKSHASISNSEQEIEQPDFVKEFTSDSHLRVANPHGRELALSDEHYDVASNVWSHITKDSWMEAIEKQVYDEGSDKAKVDLIDHVCYITAKESDDGGDWTGNFDFGFENIDSSLLTSQTASSCGCESYYWFWKSRCKKYKTCSSYHSVGRGYAGFVKAANQLRFDIKDEIIGNCTGADKYVFGGYSRGGGIVQVLAYLFLKDGLIESSKTSLVTFGSPRSLRKDEAEWLHSTLPESIRIVYKDDPTCAVPFHWLGYKHVGVTRVCANCTYYLDVDRPYNVDSRYLSSHSESNYSKHIFGWD